MALEDGRCENPFFLLANANKCDIKKSASVLHWPHSQTLEEPIVELQRKSMSLRIFTIRVALNTGTYGWDAGKYNTSRPIKQFGD
jgi:hypothetical protein